ncbi:MAG: hypothetical protein ABSD29_22245 [Verrucomicrobiota bacterium]
MSNAELKATTHRFVSVVDGLARVVQMLVKWGGIAAIAFFAYKSIACLSGQTTVAQLALNILGNITFSKSVVYTVAGGSAVWALGERSFRKKNVGSGTV